jgi:hypothetical protein
MPSGTRSARRTSSTCSGPERCSSFGTLVYSLDESWNVVDSLYFAVSTLTTTSVSDPDLALTDGWVKVFTVLYQLIGIGILVEILRRLGIAFVAVQTEERRAKRAGSG